MDFQGYCKEIFLIQIYSWMPLRDTVVAMITKHNNRSDRQHHFHSTWKWRRAALWMILMSSRGRELHVRGHITSNIKTHLALAEVIKPLPWVLSSSSHHKTVWQMCICSYGINGSGNVFGLDSRAMSLLGCRPRLSVTPTNHTPCTRKLIGIKRKWKDITGGNCSDKREVHTHAYEIHTCWVLPL